MVEPLKDEAIISFTVIVDTIVLDVRNVSTVSVPLNVVPCTASFVSVSYIIKLEALALRIGAM